MASSGLADLQSSTQLQNRDVLEAQWSGIGVALELRAHALSPPSKESCSVRKDSVESGPDQRLY